MNHFLINPTSESTAILQEDEARHCIKVLRKKPGEQIEGIDGAGFYYKTRIERLGKGIVHLEILEKKENVGEHQKQITVGVSPLRLQDRFEWIVEKSVELGANFIVPVITCRTVKHNIRQKRLKKIMISAMKQCMRSRLPALKGPTELEDYLEQQKNAELKLMANAESSSPLQVYASRIRDAGSISILIGPEGDFDPGEIELIKNHAWEHVSLGENRLRTETAVGVMLSGIKIFSGY